MKFFTSIVLILTLLCSISVFAAPIQTNVAESTNELTVDFAEAVLSAELTEEAEGSLLTGTEIYGGEFNSAGDEPKWNNSNNTDQLFMKTSKTEDVYVGYKLSSPKVITKAVIYPDVRTSNDQIAAAYNRIVGATIEASTDNVNWEILATVTSEAKAIIDQKQGLPLTFNIAGNTPIVKEYSYVRFCMRKGVGVDTYFSFSEVYFYGIDKPETKLVSDKLLEGNRFLGNDNELTADWTDGIYSSGKGNERVFFTNKASTEAYAGFEYGAHKVIPTRVEIVPTKDAANSFQRIKNSVIQGRTADGSWETIITPDFSTYKSKLDAGELITISFDIDTQSKEYSALRLYRASGSDFLSFVDLAFYGYMSSDAEKLTGSQIFSHDATGTYYKGTKPTNVFDGNTDTYLMIYNTVATDGSNDIWAGYDFGEGNAVVLTDVGYYGYNGDNNTPERVKGQIFQGSNDNESWTDLAVIKTGTKGQHVYFDIFDSTPYRYVRLYDENGAFDKTTSSSGSFYMQAEIEFYGHYAEKYTVTFKGGEGSSEENKVVLFENSTVNVAEHDFDDNENYLFIGWVDENGETVDGTITVTKDIELTAQWKYVGVAPLSFNENSIRVNDPDGIRFKSAVVNTVKNDEKTTEYGYIVTLESLVGDNDVVEDLKFDNNGKIRYVYGVSYGYDDTIDKDVDRIYKSDSDYTYFTAVIYGVERTKEALSGKIIVRPYIKYNNETIYGTPMSRSVFEVAKVLKETRYENLKQDEKDYIDEILTICESAS